MRRFLLMSASVVGLGLTLPAAQAADIIAPAVDHWTGFHVGVGGGVGDNCYDGESHFFKPIQSDSATDLTLDIAADNCKWYGFGTVEIGHDVHIEGSPVILGLFVSFDLNEKAKLDKEDLEQDGEEYELSSLKASLGDSFFIGGRFGVLLEESTLLYTLLGYTFVDGKVRAYHSFNTNDFGGMDDDALFEDKQDVGGMTFGVGLERLLTEFLSLKLEYRHDFLDEIKWSGPAFDPAIDGPFGDPWEGIDDDNTHDGKMKFGRDTLRLVLSLRLGSL